MAVKGVKEKIWPMRFGGPYSKTEGTAVEGYKCTGCGAETYPEKGFNGEPDRHRCSKDCRHGNSDWKPGTGNKRIFNKNFDHIFPNAPCAGL
jgi:hypothetical protein